MIPGGHRALISAVLVLAAVQVVFEDLLVFLGATGGDAGSLHPFVYVAIPTAISLLLIGLILGSALLAPTSQPERRFSD